jgi:hypothetical protein
MQSSLRIMGLTLKAALLLSWLSGVSVAQAPIPVSGHVLNVDNKPIPGVTITANGVETAPAVTESSGLYIIVLKIPPGQPVHFHLERKSYSVLNSTVAVAPPLPTDFKMHSNNIVSPQAALTSLYGGLHFP